MSEIDVSWFGFPREYVPERDSWSPEDSVPDVEDSDIEREIDRYFRQFEDDYSVTDMVAW